MSNLVLGLLGSIGSTELMLLFFVVLVLFGPKQLPQIARTIGKGLRDIRRAANQLKHEVGLDELDDLYPSRRTGPNVQQPAKRESPFPPAIDAPAIIDIPGAAVVAPAPVEESTPENAVEPTDSVPPTNSPLPGTAASAPAALEVTSSKHVASKPAPPLPTSPEADSSDDET